MLEYEEFVYLDVEKTGSTTIRRFLRKFAKSPVVADKKHQPPREKKPEKIYIISCRDPASQYKSLYKHGVKGRGAIFTIFKNKGLSYLYDHQGSGYAEWLNIILSPEECLRIMRRKNHHEALEFFGFQTLRFLTRDLPDPKEILDNVHSKDDIIRLYEENSLHNILIKTESLTEDLIDMLHGPYANVLSNVKEAEEYLQSGKRSNVSKNVEVPEAIPSPELLKKMQEREWFFFEKLGYAPYV